MTKYCHQRCILRVLSFIAIIITTACGGGDSDSGGGPSHTVSTSAISNGSISPTSANVNEGATASFTVTPNQGYGIADVSGCDGSLSGNTYTTGAITGACEISATFALPGVPVLMPTSIKNFRFNWVDVSSATHYKLLENIDGTSGYTQVGNDIVQGTQTADRIVPLYARLNAQYILQSCDSTGCSDSSPVTVTGSLIDAIGYFKASNTVTIGRSFGESVSLSADGTTLAVGESSDSGRGFGVNGDDRHLTSHFSGAVFVFKRDGNSWTQQAYIKASNSDHQDEFGESVSLSADGNTLVVGARREASSATGIDGNQSDNSLIASGAAYVFSRSGDTWIQQTYLKASNTGEDDYFGSAVSVSANGNYIAVGAYGKGAVYIFLRNENSWSQQAYLTPSNGGGRFSTSLSLDADGNTLVVGAPWESSNATGVDGDQSDTSANWSGAAYVFVRDLFTWRQQAYLKASNTDAEDYFGFSISLADDGNTLAVGAKWESSNALGVGSNQSDNSVNASGAVYIFNRDVLDFWTHEQYIKASNTGQADVFGTAVSLAADGNTLAVGASGEASSTTGLNGTQNDDSALKTGAVYLFTKTDGFWRQQSYIKASNAEADDKFGYSVALSADGKTLAAGATGEKSKAKGVGSDQNNDSTTHSAGAVYLY